jgi:hypothetical protein
VLQRRRPLVAEFRRVRSSSDAYGVENDEGDRAGHAAERLALAAGLLAVDAEASGRQCIESFERDLPAAAFTLAVRALVDALQGGEDLGAAAL